MAVSFAHKYGPWALVTGASRGLGAEFARQCAARGLNIVLAAKSAALLEAQAEGIRHDYGVAVKTLALDLGREDIMPEIRAVTDGLEVGLLVNNAGISKISPFLDLSAAYLTQQLHVNVRAGLLLAHHFGGRMAARGRGGIIFLSSASALYGTGYCANYAGTKAYNLILAESLWYELGPYGVDVLGLMAGATKTPGWESNAPRPARFVPVMDARPTVAEALRALGKQPSLIAGGANRLGYWFMGKALPRRRAIRLVSDTMAGIFGPFKDGLQPE